MLLKRRFIAPPFPALLPHQRLAALCNCGNRHHLTLKPYVEKTLKLPKVGERNTGKLKDNRFKVSQIDTGPESNYARGSPVILEAPAHRSTPVPLGKLTFSRVFPPSLSFLLYYIGGSSYVIVAIGESPSPSYLLSNCTK